MIDVHALVRWKAMRNSKGQPKKVNPTGTTVSCDEARILCSVALYEDFGPIFDSLEAHARPDLRRSFRDELFRDLLRLRSRGVIVDYGPDLWMLAARGSTHP